MVRVDDSAHAGATVATRSISSPPTSRLAPVDLAFEVLEVIGALTAAVLPYSCITMITAPACTIPSIVHVPWTSKRRPSFAAPPFALLERRKCGQALNLPDKIDAWRRRVPSRGDDCCHQRTQGSLVRFCTPESKRANPPPTVVLVHGILGSRKNLHRFAERILRDFPAWQAILVDLR